MNDLLVPAAYVARELAKHTQRLEDMRAAVAVEMDGMRDALADLAGYLNRVSFFELLTCAFFVPAVCCDSLKQLLSFPGDSAPRSGQGVVSCEEAEPLGTAPADARRAFLLPVARAEQ